MCLKSQMISFSTTYTSFVDEEYHTPIKTGVLDP